MNNAIKKEKRAPRGSSTPFASPRRDDFYANDRRHTASAFSSVPTRCTFPHWAVEEFQPFATPAHRDTLNIIGPLAKGSSIPVKHRD